MPESASVPLHAYEYVPLPPEGAAVQVDDCPVIMLAGEALHDPLTGGRTVTVFPQLIVLEEPAEVTVTDALLVPLVAYVLETALEVPLKLSVPLHE